MRDTRCSAIAAGGGQCRKQRAPGRDVCAFHDQSPEARARHQAISAKGGHARAEREQLTATAPLAEEPGVAELDLASASGIRDFAAATLRGLSRLPLDARLANAITGLLTAQRAMLESSDLEARLAALEARLTSSHLRAS